MAGNSVDIAIVGGGLAGLSAAYKLRDRKVVVLEASDRPGGRVFSLPRDNYWLNFGAHMFEGPGTRVGDLVAELGLETKPIQGELLGMSFNNRRLLKGGVEFYPFRLPISLSARASFIKMGLALRMGTMAAARVLRPRANETQAARRERVQNFRNDRTLGQMVGALHPEVKNILRAITERSGGDPDEMAAGYALRSFINVWSKGSPGRNLIGGSARFPQALAKALGESVRTNSAVTSVTERGDHVEIQIKSGNGTELITARRCILATPAYVTGEITRNIPAGMKSALKQIKYGSFLSVAVLTKESGTMPWDGNYAISTPKRAFSVVFNQATTLRSEPSQRPGGSLMLFSGATKARQLLELTDQQIEGRFISDLVAEFPESAGTISEAIVQRWDAGAPYSWPGRGKLQRDLTQPAGRITLAGDYLDFPNMEAAVSTGQEAAEHVEQQMSAETSTQ